jgi:predicted transcriptional regulator
MQLADWLRAKNISIKAFSESLQVERAMIYRYFSGAVPRARTIRRIEELTAGAVTAQDFHINAVKAERYRLSADSQSAETASAA